MSIDDLNLGENGGMGVKKPSPYFPICEGGEVVPAEDVAEEELTEAIA